MFTIRFIDTPAVSAQVRAVKRSKTKRQRKSEGTLIVEQHRPLMNKLTDSERQRLMKAGYELIYGSPRQPEPADRRG